jgi:transposase
VIQKQLLDRRISMSASVVYHGFGIRGYEYERTYYEDGAVTFVIRQARERLRCPRCNSPHVERRGGVTRMFRLVPIGRKPVQAVLDIARVSCPRCQITRQVKVEFADENRRYARNFERYVLELSRNMTIDAVAQHLQIHWNTVKEIQKLHLERHYSRPKLKHLKEIAIDEISIGRGNKFLTVVMDLRSGAVVFVGKGRGSEALLPFWKRLRASQAKIRAVAIDMSRAYTAAVRDHLPNAVLVYDHFHIIKLFNEKLTDLRRDLYRQAVEGLHKDVLKGIRWLLLKNPENLDPKKRERERLDEDLELNAPLFVAYYMKEQLRQLWSQPDKRTARQFLNGWIRLAGMTGILILMNFAKTLATYREGILAWYDYRISTGPLEGTNNKIKTMKRQAYGFRDHEFFILKIMAIHEATYALVG